MRKLRWSKGHFKERGTVGKWAAWPTALSTSPCGPVVPITFTKGKKKQNQKPRPYSGGSVPSNTSYSRVCWLQEQQSTQPGLQGAAQLLHPCPLQKIRFHWAVAESGALPSFGSSGILLSWDRIAQGRLISIVHIPKITPLSPPWTICSNSTERNLKVPPHCCLQQKVVPPPAARFYRSAPSVGVLLDGDPLWVLFAGAMKRRNTGLTTESNWGPVYRAGETAKPSAVGCCSCHAGFTRSSDRNDTNFTHCSKWARLGLGLASQGRWWTLSIVAVLLPNKAETPWAGSLLRQWAVSHWQETGRGRAADVGNGRRVPGITEGNESSFSAGSVGSLRRWGRLPVGVPLPLLSPPLYQEPLPLWLLPRFTGTQLTGLWV